MTWWCKRSVQTGLQRQTMMAQDRNEWRKTAKMQSTTMGDDPMKERNDKVSLCDELRLSKVILGKEILRNIVLDEVT